MLIRIKRFDKTLPLPQYQTTGAAAIDLYSREKILILPHQIAYIPLNVAIELPKNYFVLIAARSSLHKKGLMMANGIGIGDYDYRGDKDEYRAALLNFTDKPVEVLKGERVVQMLVLHQDRAEIAEVEKLTSPNRGGFGSTGDQSE